MSSASSPYFTVACGPAVEIQRFIRTTDLVNQSALHLMDFNEETLEYTMQRRVNEAMTELAGSRR